MKSIHRVALFAVCSLSLACVEPAPSQPHKAPKQAKVELPKLMKAEPDQAFSATAPAQPRSILDSTKPTAAPEAATAPATEVKSEPAKEANKVAEVSGDKASEELKLAPADVHIDRFVLATGVDMREPIGESETFTTETEKIFAFVQFENEQGAPFAVRVHWEKVDGPASPYGVELEVPTAKRWRTWSWTKIRRSPGQYRAVLRTLDGEEIASRTFVIEDAESAASEQNLD